MEYSQLNPHETASTTCIVRPRKMQRFYPRQTHTNYEVKCKETFVYTEGQFSTNRGRETEQRTFQIRPAENATNPGKWTRDSGGAPSSGQTLPYPHPSVNPTVKRGGTAWMTADRHHSPPDQINRRLKCHRDVTFFPSLPHSAFTSTTHRKMSTSDLVCCQPPIRHKGANSRC